MVARRVCMMLLGVATCALIASSLRVPAGSIAAPAVPDTPSPGDFPGTTVTIYELSECVTAYNFTMAELMTTGGSFRTPALFNETYSVTSDGTNITIGCYHFPPFNRTGVATGNNIVAVEVNGMPGYPSGLWASVVVSFSLGYGGIPESRFNALGPADQLGPFGDYLCTFMGDYASELVLGFEGTPVEVVQGTLDFDPDTINLKSSGRWVTCYIELPDGYSVSDISASGLTLNDAVHADPDHKLVVGDSDEDGVPDMAVKFDREAVQATLAAGEDVAVWVSGELTDGTLFTASDLITVVGSSA